MNIVKRKKNYEQVCIWPGMSLGDATKEEFEKLFKDELGFRVQYLEEIQTYPDKDEDGNDIPNTGGRNDLFFSIHNNDIPQFSLWRLGQGIRWIEDVLSDENYTSPIYPERIFEYKTWDADKS